MAVADADHCSRSGLPAILTYRNDFPTLATSPEDRATSPRSCSLRSAFDSDARAALLFGSPKPSMMSRGKAQSPRCVACSNVGHRSSTARI